MERQHSPFPSPSRTSLFMHPYLLDVSSWIYLKLAFKFPMVINLPCSRPGVNISRTVGCGWKRKETTGGKR